MTPVTNGGESRSRNELKQMRLSTLILAIPILLLLLSGCEFAALMEEEEPTSTSHGPGARALGTPELKVDFKPAGSFTLILNGESTKLPIPALIPQSLDSKPFVHARCTDASGAELLSLKFYLPPEALDEHGRMATYSSRDPQELSEGFVVTPDGRVEIKGGTWTSNSGAARFQALLQVETDQGPASGRVAASTYEQ